MHYLVCVCFLVCTIQKITAHKNISTLINAHKYNNNRQSSGNSKKRPRAKALGLYIVRLTGLEPAHRETLDPKSNASTNFATGAGDFHLIAVQRYD